MMAGPRRKEAVPKNNDKVASRKRIIRPNVNSTSPASSEARDEVNHYNEKHRPTNFNCSPIVTPNASTSTAALWNTNVRDQVMNWENKLILPDEVQM